MTLPGNPSNARSTNSSPSSHGPLDSASAYLALHLLPGIGPLRAAELIAGCGSPEAVFTASRDQLRTLTGPKTLATLANWADQIDLEAEWRAIENAGATLTTWGDPAYPAALRQIHAPPLALYHQGDLLPRDRHAIAVVGTRQMSRYGRETAHRFSFQLARLGYTIVSGLAYGVDTSAHEAAIAAGGRTLAVLGSSLDHLYPPENAALARRIAQQGAVVSQFPMGTKPEPRLFPARNLVVSGLCQGVLIVEGNVKSGSMLTARSALEQNRLVFAVPGQIDRPGSSGPNRLIQDGAKLVMDIDDLLEELSELPLELEASPTPSPAPVPVATGSIQLTAEERSVMEAVGAEPVGVEEVVRKTGLPPSVVSSTLMRLQIRNLVRQLPGMHFVIS